MGIRYIVNRRVSLLGPLNVNSLKAHRLPGNIQQTAKTGAVYVWAPIFREPWLTPFKPVIYDISTWTLWVKDLENAAHTSKAETSLPFTKVS